MNIEDKLNELLIKQKKIEMEISHAKKELKTFMKDKKRAKSDIAKASIQQENIDPINNTIKSLKRKNEILSMQLLAIESHILGEEIKTRTSGSTTVTKLDNKYRLKFLFSKLRRFGNFTGYLSGRKEEADNKIKNYLIKKVVSDYIKANNRRNALYSKYGIDPSSETAIDDLSKKIIEEEISKEISTDSLDEELNKFISNVVNTTSHNCSDRGEMLSKLIKTVPKKAPSTKFLDSFNIANDDGPKQEQENDNGER